jgi:acetolactate synthase-1/3 small subunit
MLHTFVALVEDKPGVLSRVSLLFRRLNVNIYSLSVGRSERAGVSRMTIVADASSTASHRIMASLYKLENVLEVDDVGHGTNVSRELALIKVAATVKTRSHIFELVEVFRARIVDLAPESLMIELTGVESKIEGLIQVLTESGDEVLEVARTGRMVMRRGQHSSRVLTAMRIPDEAGPAHNIESEVLEPDVTAGEHRFDI